MTEALARLVDRAEKDRAAVGVCALRPDSETRRICEHLVLAGLNGANTIHRHRYAVLLARGAQLVLEVWVATRRVQGVASAEIASELTSPAAGAPGNLRVCLVGVGNLAFWARDHAADHLPKLLFQGKAL